MTTTLIDTRMLERITQKKKRMNRIRPHSKSALQKLKERFALEWTYNSNAIEGNSLTLNETRLILETGLTVKGKPLREHFEAINHKEAIDRIETMVKTKSPITQDTIKKIHALILKGISDTDAGTYRSVRVRIPGAVFTPPDPVKINRQMSELISWLNKEKTHPIDLAAQAHHKLVHIHPFTDGNGRTSRLIMNLILMRAGYPPAIILNNDRKKYYDRLKKADRGDIKPFTNFIAQSTERSLTLYLEALEPVKQGDQNPLILLREAAKATHYSQEYLSLLARTGKLGATKISRNWHISKQELNTYLKNIEKKKKGNKKSSHR